MRSVCGTTDRPSAPTGRRNRNRASNFSGPSRQRQRRGARRRREARKTKAAERAFRERPEEPADRSPPKAGGGGRTDGSEHRRPSPPERREAVAGRKKGRTSPSRSSSVAGPRIAPKTAGRQRYAAGCQHKEGPTGTAALGPGQRKRRDRGQKTNIQTTVNIRLWEYKNHPSPKGRAISARRK